MNRRRFLRRTGEGLAITAGGLAGCLGNDAAPPPRKAEVFDDVTIEDGTMEIDLHSQPKVESQIDNVDEAAIVGSLLPIGTARAGSRSSSSGSRTSGATGRGTKSGFGSAPKGRHHWAIYGGHSHSSWRDDHDDDLEMYRAVVATLAVAYIGTQVEYEAKSPGPGPANVTWDEEWTDPTQGATYEVDLAPLSSGAETEPESDSQSASETGTESTDGNETDAGTDTGSGRGASEGWYRVGTELESPDGDGYFDWQAADFKLERKGGDGLAVDEAWHVRPRL
ncbi:hypothetical protein [Natrinema caseinilyticum]|uniref:hypothetical protein n=1 Tax=Natrinema caseinilyticum TaxID=2961570 RepID=UPI0020C4CE54|nr:hypothetical protein [Natrinema caseinilyticum]